MLMNTPQVQARVLALRPNAAQFQGDRHRKRVQSPNLAEKQSKIPGKPVLLSLDIDGTLIPWIGDSETRYDTVAFQRYQQALNQPPIAGDAFVLINTGRGLNSVQTLLDSLQHFPVDALGVNDGQQLFVRDRGPDNWQAGQPEPLATREWLANLGQISRDKTWKQALNGWSIRKAIAKIRLMLPSLGFQPLQPGPNEPTFKHSPRYFQRPISGTGAYWLVCTWDDQAYFEVYRSDLKATRAETRQVAREIGEAVQAECAADWPDFTHTLNAHERKTYVQIGPGKISKRDLAEHVVNRFATRPVAVVSTGDSGNDLALLTAESVAGVPNYPVRVGQHAGLTHAFKAHRPTHLEEVAEGRLDDGLKRQFAKLVALLRPKTQAS